MLCQRCTDIFQTDFGRWDVSYLPHSINLLHPPIDDRCSLCLTLGRVYHRRLKNETYCDINYWIGVSVDHTKRQTYNLEFSPKDSDSEPSEQEQFSFVFFTLDGEALPKEHGDLLWRGRHVLTFPPVLYRQFSLGRFSSGTESAEIITLRVRGNHSSAVVDPIYLHVYSTLGGPRFPSDLNWYRQAL